MRAKLSAALRQTLLFVRRDEMRYLIVSSAACLASLAVSIMPAYADSQDIAGTGIAIDFGNAAVSGVGKILRAGHVPIVYNGSTVYLNLEFELQANPSGFGAMLLSASPAQGPAVDALSSTLNFKIGNYTGKDPYFVQRSSDQAVNNPNCSYSLSSPSTTADGRRLYILAVNRPVNNPLITPPACPPDASIVNYVWLTGPAALNSEIGNSGRSNSFLRNTSATYAYGRDSINNVFRVFQNNDVLNITYLNGNGDPMGGNLYYGYPITLKFNP